jgi:multidrug efflux pump subunit AcrA (membrane-fusion protein)
MTVRCHFLGVAAVVAAVGCNRPQSSGPAAGASPEAPVAVVVVSPVKKTLQTAVEQPASVHPFEVTTVVAKLAGYVKDVKVDIGDVVEPGTPLAELDIPELVQEAEQKKALVTLAGAEKEQAKQSLEVAKARVTAAQAVEAEVAASLSRAQADYERWASEYARTEKLVKDKVLDPQILDETKRQFRSAEAMKQEATAKGMSAAAAVVEAKAMAVRADADVAAADAKLGVASADANRVAALLGYTHIRAPFAGIVTLRTVHPGHFLQPSSGMRVEPIFTVARVDKLRVVLDVPESATPQAKVGAAATVRVPALANREYPGTVSRTAGVLSPETRTMRVEVDVTNSDGALKPGMYATARIAATLPDVTELPATAILFADETAYAFRVIDGKVSKVVVRVGRADGAAYEVLGCRPASGAAREWTPLSLSDSLVAGHLGALADGQPVTIKKE